MAFLRTSLKLKFQDLSEESSYKITITSDDVEIIAGDESGFYYALISLMQLSQSYHQLVPCGSIFDKPRFSWRGQHLDTVRHFYAVDSLLRLLDLMSLFKLNKFHWHGTDDEAFRFKLKNDYEPFQLDEELIVVKTLIEEEGDDAGKEVHQEAGALRLSDLINKDPMFDFCYTHPRLLAAVRQILTSDFKVHSLNCRFAIPGEGQQGFHMDWGPRDKEDLKLSQNGHYFVANSLWLLDDFTATNGPTRLVPGSHKWGKSPKEVMDDPTSAHPDEVKVVAPAGTVVAFNSHVWHGGSLNRSHDLRRAMHMAFVRRNLPQQTDQRQYLRPNLLFCH